MKNDYTIQDIERAKAWYQEHKNHVDNLVKFATLERKSFPMSGSDISRPELWKAGAWKWFFERNRE